MDEQNQQSDQGGMDQQSTTDQAPPQQETPQPQQSGGGQGKLWGVLGYIISVLFFVPLISDETKNNPYSRFHANQQLLVLITWIAGSVLMSVFFLGAFLHLFAFVLMIIGIVNAAGGHMKKLPLIGDITIIK